MLTGHDGWQGEEKIQGGMHYIRESTKEKMEAIVISIKLQMVVDHALYANTLAELREKEDKIKGLKYDGVDYATIKRLTVNDVVDKYISLKFALRGTTNMVYTDMYDKHIQKKLWQI